MLFPSLAPLSFSLMIGSFLSNWPQLICLSLEGLSVTTLL